MDTCSRIASAAPWFRCSFFSHFKRFSCSICIMEIDVVALAKLARLEVSDEELAKLEREIPDILKFVETIQAVSAQGYDEPKKESLINVMRADENPHEGGIYTEALLEAAPARVGNRIAVKQVLSRKNPKSEARNPKKS